MQILDWITEEQKAAWAKNGYLILPGFYSHEQVDELDAITDWIWREKPTELTVDHTVTMRRSRFSDIEGPRDGNRLKLNDIFLQSETLRRTILDRRLTPILTSLLGDDPVLINTLTIDLGTNQSAHVDTLFMTPHSEDALIATWTALEDVMIDAGPLFYYPGSHLLEPYRFSSGLQHIIDSEFQGWYDAIHSGLRDRKIDRQIFLAKKGDVFIWHARLVHGGSEVLNLERTRKSLVAHFFTKTDCLYHEMPVRRLGDAYWLNRSPQPAATTADAISPPPPGRIVRQRFRPANRDVRITVDYVTLQHQGRRLKCSEPIVVDRSDTLLVRGWAADVDRQRNLRSVLVETSGGVYVEARSNLGRHDLVRVFGYPAFAQAGFLASVPATLLQPGINTLRFFGVADDGESIHGSPATSLNVEVR